MHFFSSYRNLTASSPKTQLNPSNSKVGIVHYEISWMNELKNCINALGIYIYGPLHYLREIYFPITIYIQFFYQVIQCCIFQGYVSKLK